MKMGGGNRHDLKFIRNGIWLKVPQCILSHPTTTNLKYCKSRLNAIDLQKLTKKACLKGSLQKCNRFITIFLWLRWLIALKLFQVCQLMYIIVDYIEVYTLPTAVSLAKTNSVMILFKSKLSVFSPCQSTPNFKWSDKPFQNLFMVYFIVSSK